MQNQIYPTIFFAISFRYVLTSLVGIIKNKLLGSMVCNHIIYIDIFYCNSDNILDTTRTYFLIFIMFKDVDTLLQCL